MSLDVALQSVAFYVLSCGACAKVRHRHKAKAKAKRERAEKLELENELPGLYRHPSPFATNPYWSEEITMGPNRPKKGSNKNNSQRALNSTDLSVSVDSPHASVGVLSNVASSPTAVTEQGSRVSGEGWNFKRYQREDEDLWGHDVPGPGQRIMDAIAKASSSAGRYIEGRLSRFQSVDEENAVSHYFLPSRNPPVNELHPPVVSTAPSSRDEARWMLQPPPSARIMEGKERVHRSRAGSGASSTQHSIPLSRQVTERLVDARLQKGEMPQPSPSRYPSMSNRSMSSVDSSFRAAPPSKERRPRPRQRSMGSYPDSSDSEDDRPVSNRKTRRRPPPLSLPSNAASRTPSSATIRRISRSPSQGKESDHTSTPALELPADPLLETASTTVRPSLSTIVSSSNLVPQQQMQSLRAPLICEPSPAQSQDQLASNVNAMPATLPSVQLKPDATMLSPPSTPLAAHTQDEN